MHSRLTYVSACEEKQWHLRVWPVGEITEGAAVPFMCKSWRHAGRCSWWKGSQDFVRVRNAVLKRKWWTFVVLTFPRPDSLDPALAYKCGVLAWTALRKRLTRVYGKFPYIQTWERHQNGWPHVNVIISSKKFQADCKKYQVGWRNPILEIYAVFSGFGHIHHAEPARSKKRVAGYLTKLSRELTGCGTKDQTPINAPAGFRRLRASSHTLETVFKNAGLEGRLLFEPLPVLAKQP